MSPEPDFSRLSRAQFERIRQRVHEVCGINLHSGKECLVRSRLVKRLRALGLDNFEKYMQYVERDNSGRELSAMIDVLTTNKTNFFREPQHFEFLSRELLPRMACEDRPVNFWSAGCSSGEEPYTLAMLLKEAFPSFPRREVRILATDISTSVLAAAREAVYGAEVAEGVPPVLLKKYFTRVPGVTGHRFRVREELKAMVRLARLNLMGEWPMRGPFDAIFCRNVMIYFDKPTQQKLAHRFWELLAPGGHLFIGHSESLTNLTRELRYVRPAIYVK